MNKNGKRTDAPKGRKASTNSERIAKTFGKSNIVDPERVMGIKEILQQNEKQKCENIKKVAQDIADATSKAVEKAYKMPQRVVLAMSIEQASLFLEAMEGVDRFELNSDTNFSKEVDENWKSIKARIRKTLESHKGKGAQ